MKNINDRFPKLTYPEIKLHRGSFIPYYQQIANQVRHFIESHDRSIAGGPFWSEGEVAQRLAISKMTVRQAFQILRGEGLLVIEKGKRPVIGSGRASKNFQELQGFTNEMLRRGMKPSSRLLEMHLVEPDSSIARALRLTQNNKVFCLKRLRYADDQLVGLETACLPYHFFHGLEKHDLQNSSLYGIIEDHYGIRLNWSEEELQAIAATEEEARQLKVPSGFPLFSMRRTVYDTADNPIEHCVSLFRGDRYRAVVISRRNQRKRSNESSIGKGLIPDRKMTETPRTKKLTRS